MNVKGWKDVNEDKRDEMLRELRVNFFDGQQTVDELIRKQNVLCEMPSIPDDDGKEIEISSATNPPFCICKLDMCLQSHLRHANQQLVFVISVLSTHRKLSSLEVTNELSGLKVVVCAGYQEGVVDVFFIMYVAELWLDVDLIVLLLSSWSSALLFTGAAGELEVADVYFMVWLKTGTCIENVRIAGGTVRFLSWLSSKALVTELCVLLELTPIARVLWLYIIDSKCGTVADGVCHASLGKNTIAMDCAGSVGAKMPVYLATGNDTQTELNVVGRNGHGPVNVSGGKFKGSRETLFRRDGIVRLQEFWHTRILMNLAGGIGIPLRVDNTMLIGNYGYFARVLVDVDLTRFVIEKLLLETTDDCIEVDLYFESFFGSLYFLSQSWSFSGYVTTPYPSLGS
ncbi:hypothetical protein FNV43_RR27132 [Rhamnella rubrinervis]|uniref:Uncharacterized protein n=1 Tax=Rhamnella rubrinervis TaxID=2594499 RepID=A0A8K0DJU7_9ROSA|nr:hypothetical protein FNV43_RR27132 [Rhamnella rubrinervis]